MQDFQAFQAENLIYSYKNHVSVQTITSITSIQAFALQKIFKPHSIMLDKLISPPQSRFDYLLICLGITLSMVDQLSRPLRG